MVVKVHRNEPRVWIMAPTLNEAANIVELLTRIERSLSDIPHCLCVIDDGSTDGTPELIRRFAQTSGCDIHILQRQKTQSGSQRGSALWISVKKGVQESASDIFVEMDADLSHRPEELKTGIEMVRGGSCDFAIASKYAVGSHVVNRRWWRRMVSRVASFAVRKLLSGKISDYSNGYRFYNRQCAEVIAGYPIRYGSPIYLSEIIALLLSRGMRFEEFPTTYVGRGEGISKLRPGDLAKAALAVLDISLRYRLGRFEQCIGTDSL